MPDGDRFLRKLIGTGRGWGTAYKLASCNSEYLPAQIIKACADNLRGFSDESIPAAIESLNTAFDREKWSVNENLLSSLDVFSILERECRSIKLKEGFELGNILEKSIKSVFLANKNDAAKISGENIVERLGETLALNIMDSRWLSRVRDGVMAHQNRDITEQRIWEQNLRGQILPAARKMMKSYCEGKNNKKFRAPAFKKAKKSTSDILTKRLTVLSPV